MDKKGSSILMMIFEVLAVSLIIYMTISIAHTYASSELTIKTNVAEDIRMMANTLAGVPGDALVEYPHNVSELAVILRKEGVVVFKKGDSEHLRVDRAFFLPAGYDAFGTLEGKDRLCLEKEKKKMVLRECTLAKQEENILPEISSERLSFYGIPITGDRIVFVIDRSTSMEVPSEWEFSEFEAPEGKGGSRFDVAVWQFRNALEDLPDGKFFAVVLFNDKITDETVFSKKFAEVNDENREKAHNYVKNLKPAGFTNLYDALKLALKYEDVDTIFLITDGFPSIGLINHDQLLMGVKELNVHGAKINTIGTFVLGKEGSTARQDKEKGEKLLKTLAEQNDGVFVMRVK